MSPARGRAVSALYGNCKTKANKVLRWLN